MKHFSIKSWVMPQNWGSILDGGEVKYLIFLAANVCSTSFFWKSRGPNNCSSNYKLILSTSKTVFGLRKFPAALVPLQLPKWNVLYAFTYGKRHVWSQVFLLCNRPIGTAQSWDNMACSKPLAKWPYSIKGLCVMWAQVIWPLGGTRW